MNEFNLKYYPPRIFIFLLVALAALIFVVKKSITGASLHQAFGDGLIMLGTSSALSLLIYLGNKQGMHIGLNRIIGLPDIRGTYKGELVSSYFIDDDTSKGHVKMKFILNIEQNLNGCHVTGKITSTDSKEESSQFESEWAAIACGGGENYKLMYLYKNRPNISHPDYDKLELEGHQGFCELNYYPQTKKLTGTYFNCKRNSYGQLDLKRYS